MRMLKFRAWKVDEKRMVALYPDASYPDDSWSSANLIEGHNWKVMQFTGLLDRFGAEIYEGDILQQNVESLMMTVVWQEGKYILRGAHDADLAFYARSCSKIGNIYENPELLPQ